ncbi:MAG TPA: HPr family phosphocarrier protein [Thermoguttaceae bacterium]|nr:HPr family phosphocarrier protein [Thermoguttaceae bacterium]
MSDVTKATREVAVTNEEGIHARAATLIAELVRRFDSKVEVVKDNERVESTDVLQVLSLGAGPGSKLSLEAVGGDAEEVLDALVKLFTENFSEN